MDELFFFGLVFTFRGIAKLFGNKKPGGESVFHSFLGSKSLGIENKVQGILKKETHTHTYRPFGPVKFFVVIILLTKCVIQLLCYKIYSPGYRISTDLL